MRRMEYSVTVAYTKRLARKTSDHNPLEPLNRNFACSMYKYFCAIIAANSSFVATLPFTYSTLRV